MGDGFGINYAKAYAVYARVDELIRKKNHSLMKNVYETVAYEFGYLNSSEIIRILNFVRKSRKHPNILYQKLIYEGFIYNYVYIYNTKRDNNIIEKLEKLAKKEKELRIDGRINIGFYKRGYYIYREYEKLISKHIKSDTYKILAEKFYYQNPISIFHTITKIKKALNLIGEK
jgi:hypothetical protein